MTKKSKLSETDGERINNGSKESQTHYNEKLLGSMTASSDQTPSKKLTTEELYAKHGLILVDKTAESVGTSSVHFSTNPKHGTKI